MRGVSPQVLRHKAFDVIPCSGQFTTLTTMNREMGMTHWLEKVGRR